MKILHILASNRFSGAENVVCQIISLFKGENNLDFVYCSPNGQIAEALQERNINYVPINKLSIKEVKCVIQKEKPNIIHAHDMRAGFISALVCRNIPLICHVHNNSFDSRGLNVKSIAFTLAAMKAKHIFYVSQSCLDGYYFGNRFKKKSEILYNVIDIEALKNKMLLDNKSYNYDIIFLGRLTTPKKPHRLLEVINKVCKEKKNTKVAIVGTGELEVEIKNLCHSLNLDSNIDFLGFQNNPLKMLKDSKLMLMTSRWEGTPMCALESMALGTPIVSTPTDGLKNIIKNGENGYLSDNNNTLAEHILDIIDDDNLRATLSNNCVNDSESINNKQKYRQAILSAYNNALK